MIVDDSRLARRMVRRLVEKHKPGWVILEAATAVEAAEISWGQPIDRITLDMNMPGEDGLTFHPALREIHPEAKIALLTANIQPLVQKRAHDLGLMFIAKPVTEKCLLKFISA